MSEAGSAASRKWTNRLVYFFGALGGFLWGYDTGVIGGALLFIEEDLGLGPLAQGLVVSGLAMGAALGAFSGPFADRLGRRRLVLLAAVVFFVGSLGAALAANPGMLVLFRVVMGMGIGISSVVVPLYLSEIAPTEIRGALTSLNQLMIVTGILAAFLVDYALAAYGAWRWMFAVGLVPSTILLVGMFFMPETPRWLVQQGREEDARRVLRRTRTHERVEDELREIRGIEEQAEEESGSLRKLLAAWVRPALVVAVGIACLQQFIGINTIIYYAPTTLTNVGFGDSAAVLANVGIGVINVLMTLVAMWAVDRWGRKSLLLWGLVGMVSSLAVLGITSLLLPEPTGIGAVGIVTLLCLATFVASFAVSWGPVVWVMLPEILPLRVRGAAMGVANVLHFVANVMVSLSFPVLLVALGIGPLFLGFAVIGVFAFAFTARQVTETKGRSLEQIEADLRERSLVT